MIGLQVGPEPGPVVATILDNPQQALALWNGLLENGIYVNLILPPAAPEGKSLVRCSVNAAHTSEQIEHVCQAFSKLHSSIIQ
jgi:8-amino-7-oxononanoate synthase